MTEARTNLPIEVIELIIDELATRLYNEEDYKNRQSRDDLYNCALICRGLYPRASSHIFYHIDISRKSGSIRSILLVERVEKLHYILGQNQALCSRIKSLTIETFNNVTSPKLLLLNNRHLPQIFSRLSSISSFSWINHNLPLPWASLSPSMNEGFKLLTSKPSLISLKFFGIEDFDSKLLLLNQSLRYLELIRVEPPAQRTTGDMVKLTTASSIRTHVNRNAPHITRELLSISPMFFSKLRELRIWMRNSEEVGAAWEGMQSAFQTLETLDIDDLSHFQYPILIPGPVDLGVLVRLQHLKMRCVIASGDGVIFPMGISGLLSPRTSPSNMETVEITIDWVDCRLGTENMRFVDEPRWASLDEALANVVTLPNLRRVSLTLRLGYGWRVRSPDIPPSEIVAVRDIVQGLASSLLKRASMRPTVKVGINVLIYRSRYAASVD